MSDVVNTELLFANDNLDTEKAREYVERNFDEAQSLADETGEKVVLFWGDNATLGFVAVSAATREQLLETAGVVHPPHRGDDPALIERASRIERENVLRNLLMRGVMVVRFFEILGSAIKDALEDALEEESSRDGRGMAN